MTALTSRLPARIGRLLESAANLRDNVLAGDRRLAWRPRLLYCIDGPPVRVCLCDPVEVITPETADLTELLLIDAGRLYEQDGQ
jgi:hypothetical protein